MVDVFIINIMLTVMVTITKCIVIRTDGMAADNIITFNQLYSPVSHTRM